MACNVSSQHLSRCLLHSVAVRLTSISNIRHFISCLFIQQIYSLGICQRKSRFEDCCYNQHFVQKAQNFCEHRGFPQLVHRPPPHTHTLCLTFTLLLSSSHHRVKSTFILCHGSWLLLLPLSCAPTLRAAFNSRLHIPLCVQ